MRTLQDRGRAKHFHGRKNIMAAFMEELELAKASGGGTTFLIQGPPGVGKTALLYKCADQAEKAEWRAVRIKGGALHDPVVFMTALGKRYETERADTAGGGIPQIAHGAQERHMVGRTVKGLMQRVARKKGLLLVLDEAQMLARYGPGSDAGDVGTPVCELLDEIHNGDMGAPVVLLAGGLGTSEAAFDSLGISRLKGDCVVNLGRLSPKAERAVITDWLVKDGKAREGAALDRWIQAIAGETDGWPQHIMAYVQPAAALVAGTQGRLTDKGLAAVLEQGAARKADYYRRRIQEFGKSDRTALAAVAADMVVEGELEEEEIVTRLADFGARKSPDTLFALAVRKGILAMNDDGEYGIPIPSMRDWLIEAYAPVRQLPAGKLRAFERGSGSGLEL